MAYIQLGNIETDVWPPEDEETKKRLDNYRRSRQLFKGQHAEVFERVQQWLEESKEKWAVYVACNFAGLISKVSADMLFGEGVKFVVGEDPQSAEQEQLDAMVEANRLSTLNYEMALGSSWRGEVIYKVRYGAMSSWLDDSERSIIEAASPSRFWPILNSQNVRDMQGGVFGYTKTGDGKGAGEKDRKYLKLERQLPGKIEHELWMLEKNGRTVMQRVKLNTFEEYKELEDSEDTGYPGLLFTFTPNWRLEDEFWGISDYYDLESIFDEINNRLSRVSRVLDKHESPRLILPPGIMKWDERTERWYVEKEDLEAIEVSGEDDSVRGDLPKYLTWDAQLSAAFQQVDKLLEIAFLVSETSPDAFGMGQGGNAESGRALKFRLIRLLAKINRKKLYFDEALKETLNIALSLEATNGSGFDPKDQDIRLEWADGIPDDPYEQAQTESIRVGDRTSSVRSAIRRLDKLDGESLEKELEAIEEDRSGELSTRVTPPENEADLETPITGELDLDFTGGRGEPTE